MHLSFKQGGNFTVEFAIVGVMFSLILVFSTDVIIKLSLKGKLDRLSYSVANILRERTQFQYENYVLANKEVEILNRIAKSSMRRTSHNFDGKRWGLSIEALQFNAQNEMSVSSFRGGNQSITPYVAMNELANLAVQTSWGRKATIYRVTMMYKTDNWFGELIGEEFNRVSSSSVIIGR
ncbi:ATP-binding protein [Moritella marina ATCC 15381]|uniref:ATP-binding protein n=1 Tax=Moritella marina ATCC 15381 TaxID=1202962 RepID=A0A5J6WQT7_MORMI|nr:tight adherence pilus pseudopilin TadF [Moritella marina]QFI38752.1 ATP-binding protein [Moritella marina ATCC 15381]